MAYQAQRRDDAGKFGHAAIDGFAVEHLECDAVTTQI